jgi:hypothetical protein
MPHIGEKAQIATAQPLSMAAQAVAVTGSPFTYMATRNGMLFVTGGTLSTIQYGRGGQLYALGLGSNPIQLIPGDTVRLTYLTAPTLTFLPTQ